MLKFFLAMRYLSKKKIVLLSITAVAISTALLVVLASLFTAFIAAIENGANDYLGDIVIEPSQRFAHSNEFIEKLNALPQVAAATPVLSASGLLHISMGNVKAVRIWGIDLKSRNKVTKIKQNLLAAKKLPDEPEFSASDKIPALVAIGLLAEPNAVSDKYDMQKVMQNINKRAVITTGIISKGQMTQIQSKSAAVNIDDIMMSGVYDIDSRVVFLPIKQMAELLGESQPSPADVIHIKCAAGVLPKDCISMLRACWAEFAEKKLNWPKYYIADTDIQTAVAKQAEYTAELKKQMSVLLVVFGIISAGVILLVGCIFYMLASAKLKDLAIIKAVGCSACTVVGVFLIFGLLVGIIGSSLGCGIGFLVTKNINTIETVIQNALGMKLWSSSIYMFSKIPNQFNFNWACKFFVLSTAACIIGAVVPAIWAGRSKPVKILRYE